MKSKLFGVWIEEVLGEEGELIEGGYFENFASLADAVDQYGMEKDIYEMIPKNIGRFAKVVAYEPVPLMVSTKPRKKK